MTLADKLANMSNKNRPGPACVVGSLLHHDSSMSNEDKKTLEHQMLVTLSDQSRLPASVIKNALEQEGYIVSLSGLMRHRRRECRCSSRGQDFTSSTVSGAKE